MPDQTTTDGGTGTTISRRRFVAGTAAATGGLAALSGCSALSNTVGGSTEEVTLILTPGTPSDVEERYRPVADMIEGEIDGVTTTMRVPQDYSAILPALRSNQAEIGMDDVTVISHPDLMDIYGTTVVGGSAFYFSLMLTNPDSDIDERSDIEGQRMAFADPLSTSGSIFALYALQQAGLDIGEAPTGDPVDFQGSFTNHEVALEKLGNGEADAATTWGGNGIPHLPADTEVPQRVQDKSSYLDTIGSEQPQFRAFWWSFPIPKQPIYARSSWESQYKSRIGELLRNSDQDLISQYYPEGYNQDQLPFTTLRNTSMETYQPVIERVNAIGIDLG